MGYSQQLKGSTMPESKEQHRKDTRAIRKLNTMLDNKDETPNSLAEKLGCARGTLFSILAGRVSPRFEVMQAAKKIGIDFEDWGKS